MTKWLGALVLTFALAGWSPSAQASMLFEAFLDGAQEVPSRNTPATGFGTVLLNDAQDMITVSLDFSGLLAAETGAHIHGPAGLGTNAPIIIPLPLGTFTDVTLPISSTNVAHLLAGLTYINVHTSLFPGGEIRGQLLAVPEPASLLLLGAGLAGLGLIASRPRGGR